MKTLLFFKTFQEFTKIFRENLDTYVENSFYAFIGGFGTERTLPPRLANLSKSFGKINGNLQVFKQIFIKMRLFAFEGQLK